MAPPLIYCGPVYNRHVEGDHFRSVLHMLRAPNIIFNPEWNDALLDRARAKSITKFLLDFPNCEIWFTVDGDITYHENDVQKICEQAMTHDIVCGQYVTRSRERCFPTTMQEDEVEVRYADDPTPVPVKWCATGFLAIHRRVVEKLIQRPDVHLCHPDEQWRFYSHLFTPFDVEGPNGWIGLSEDYAIIERARQEGFQAYVNPAVRLQHVGQYAFELTDMVYPPPEPMAMALTRTAEGRYKIEAPLIEERAA